MKKLFLTLSIVLLGTILLGCKDTENVTQPIIKSPPVSEWSSLDGTVWIHHPETDIYGQNWIHLPWAPINLDSYPRHADVCTCTWDNESPIELTFKAEGNLFSIVPNICKKDQKYFYHYEAPYISIITDFETPSNGPFTYPEYWTKEKLCPSLTIDNPKCDPNTCENLKRKSPYSCSPSEYRYLGKVDGDNMYLQKIDFDKNGNKDIIRDVHLIRIR
jgi:hypothetical protein